jgi:hypothetical protein
MLSAENRKYLGLYEIDVTSGKTGNSGRVLYPCYFRSGTGINS